MYMAVGTHWTACGWFLIACSSLSIGAMDPHTCNVGSWALKFSDVPLSKFRSCTDLLLSSRKMHNSQLMLHVCSMGAAHMHEMYIQVCISTHYQMTCIQSCVYAALFKFLCVSAYPQIFLPEVNEYLFRTRVMIMSRYACIGYHFHLALWSSYTASIYIL